MTRTQLNRMAMYRAVLDHFDQYPALWQPHPPLVEAVGGLRQALAGLEAEGQVQARGDTTGLTRDKNAQRARLCDRAFQVIRKLRPYARRVGNQTLLHAIDYGRTELENVAEADVLQRCETVHAHGQAHLSALADYGLTQAELDALRADLDVFRTLTPARDQQQAEGVAATGRLGTLFAQALHALDLLDDLVEALLDDAGFQTTYTAVRRIDDR